MNVASLSGGAYLETTGLALQTGFTIEAWMKLDNAANRQTLFSLVDTNNPANYISFIAHLSNLRMESVLAGSGAARANGAFSSFAAIDNQWAHVAVRMSDTGLMTLVIDGAQVGSGFDFNTIFTSIMPNTTWTLRVGAADTGLGTMSGAMRDLQVWDTVRTDSEIAADRTAVLSGNETGLRLYQPLTQVAGDTALTNLVSGAQAGSLHSGATFVSVDTAAFPSAPAQSSSDNVTLTGTGDVGATVTITNAATAALLGSVTVDGNGVWLLALTGQSLGAYTYNIAITDLAGNTSSTTHAVVVNSTASAPVVIDLNRDGLLTYGEVRMDVNGDGVLDNTHWAGAQDGVLVWDKYQDGQVHDNSQYAFAQYDTQSAANGTLATDLSGLAAAFDSNHDGVFDAGDAQFGEFMVWQDANQNGVSDAGEVRSLADWGLSAINLTSDGVVRTPTDGVTEYGHTTATATDASQVLVGDVAFRFDTLVVVDVRTDASS
ncbi:MAG: Ig-like domain-containing protein, partial [Burkholderiaceae bacterium]|nr:Ig-like domain-containing protein [Burkholderiaceae bacterium]